VDLGLAHQTLLPSCSQRICHQRRLLGKIAGSSDTLVPPVSSTCCLVLRHGSDPTSSAPDFAPAIGMLLEQDIKTCGASMPRARRPPSHWRDWSTGSRRAENTRQTIQANRLPSPRRALSASPPVLRLYLRGDRITIVIGFFWSTLAVWLFRHRRRVAFLRH
jgi:hypothetical protein